MYKVEVNFKPAVYTKEHIESLVQTSEDYQKIYKDIGVEIESVRISAGETKWHQVFIDIIEEEREHRV